MAVTIHVNGKTNSLVHKGSMGIAKSTIPDVCKTPSPGGPVPIPYPIIVSMSSDLKKGTKTVKVDGKKMAAVKGSEFSRCTGDEPGTAGGGVKSSTNMKEATWLLYSFDVKLDGKNACRLSDKMMMNHGNAACLGGFIQSPVAGEGIIELECRSDWNDCQRKQMKAKASALDALAKQRGGLQTRKPPKILRRVGQVFQRRFHRYWNSTSPTGRFPSTLEPCNMKKKFFDPCAETNDPTGNKMQADHVLELQFKQGNPAGPLRWIDSSVNQSSGSQIKNIRKKHGEVKVTGVQTKNC